MYESGISLILFLFLFKGMTLQKKPHFLAGIITNISAVATAKMALQRAHRPLGFSACQTTSQRLKTTTVELVKPVEMHSNNASQRSDDH